MTKDVKLQILDIKKSPYKRIQSPSPKFFRKIQAWCIFIGLAMGSTSAFMLSMNSNSKVGIALGAVGVFMTTVAPLIAKLPIDEKAVEDLLTNKTV